MNKVIVTQPMLGLLYMQVCAHKDATDKEILEVANRENPSGTSAGWCNVIRNNENEHLNPVQCNDNPERLHILLRC